MYRLHLPSCDNAKMRLLFLFLFLLLAGCFSESRGGGRNPELEPRDWRKSVTNPAAIRVDANTHLSYTLEAHLLLVRSRRVGNDGVSGMDVIGELIRADGGFSGGRVAQRLVREGAAPELYSDGVAAGSYTYGHGESTLLKPLPACSDVAPPCETRERYVLTFDVTQPPTVPVELVWRAAITVRLAADPKDQPPYEDEGELLELTLVQK